MGSTVGDIEISGLFPKLRIGHFAPPNGESDSLFLQPCRALLSLFRFHTECGVTA